MKDYTLDTLVAAYDQLGPDRDGLENYGKNVRPLIDVDPRFDIGALVLDECVINVSRVFGEKIYIEGRPSNIGVISATGINVCAKIPSLNDTLHLRRLIRIRPAGGDQPLATKGDGGKLVRLVENAKIIGMHFGCDPQNPQDNYVIPASHLLAARL